MANDDLWNCTGADEQSARLPLEARRLRKQFGGREVVRGVSLHVNHGEIVGLVGPNGAGKTTTIRMMLGILTPDDGEARAFGGPLTEETQERIGYLPEERGLYEGLRLTVVLEYLGQLKGLARRRRRCERVKCWRPSDSLSTRTRKSAS